MKKILAILTLCLVYFQSGATAAEMPDRAANLPGSSVVREPSMVSARMLSTLENSKDGWSSEEYVSIADSFGGLVDQVREFEESNPAGLYSMAADADSFYQLCRRKVRSLEEIAAEDEAALERLYRSDAWYDINYSLATFRYWQAWLDFLIASRSDNAGEVAAQLVKAERGFQITAVRILYPGVVYGSWLGMAYVDLARNNVDDAQQKLVMLQEVLSSDAGNPLKELVEHELSLLAIRRGEGLSEQAGATEPLTSQSAGLLSEEAYYLLEQQRTVGHGAIGAGQRMKRVLTSKYLNDATLSRLMTYREEIVGHDIGLLGRLIEAEYAFDYQKYNTVVLKYRAFIQGGGENLPLELTVYRYHYAAALYQIQLYGDSLLLIRSIQRELDIEDAWLPLLGELHFLVSQALYQNNPDDKTEAEVRKAAQEYIRLNPASENVGHAWVVLSQVTEDPQLAAEYLKTAAEFPGMARTTGRIQFQNIVSRVNRALAGEDVSIQKRLAKQALQQYGELARSQRKNPQIKAAALQMEVVTAEHLLETLSEIESLAAGEPLADPVLRLLFWSKLRALYGIEPQPDALTDFVVGAGDGDLDSWKKHEIFRFLLDRQKAGDYRYLPELMQTLYPHFSELPENQRQLRLLQIRALRETGREEEAFTVARQLIVEFADSGDAWLEYIESAKRLDRSFEAERGWAKITQSSARGSPRWLEGMIERVALQTGENSDLRRCELMEQLNPYQHLIQDPIRQQFLQDRESLDCSNYRTEEI